MIKKVGTGYEVRSEDGSKLLGKHKSRLSALMQLRAIEASKHGRGK